MRADMARVFVERPRKRSAFRPSPKLRRDREPDLPKVVGLRRHVALQGKYWDVRWETRKSSIMPLRRFLQRRIGQRWDSVYREACAQLDPRKGQAWLIRQRLCELVVFVSYGRRGELMGKGKPLAPCFHKAAWRYYGYRGYALVDPPHCYYVDPDDGLLKDHARFWFDRRWWESGDAC